MKQYVIEELQEMKMNELIQVAQEMGIELAKKYRKPQLISLILQEQSKILNLTEIEGILDIMDTNYGFLRTQGYTMSSSDVYVAPQIIRKYALRPGDRILGIQSPARNGEKYPFLSEVLKINGLEPEKMYSRPHFDSLIPVYPDEQYRLETDPEELTTRIIDLICPIGKGQRGLVISPPKAGKTTILKKIANAIATNYPEVHLIALLVDERPEEVTDFERSVRGEVVSSTFDDRPENHAKIADMVLLRAKRLAEMGEDVVILLDSLTRLTRAHNLIVPSSGRTLSGGLDPTAIYKPKRFFGAARKIESGGSLTIIATCLVDTGSRLDEIIYEEFKGTGNMEIHLDRNLANRRIFPAVDILKSGTRHEELLYPPEDLEKIWKLRRILANFSPLEALDVLLTGLKNTKTNAEFLRSEELRKGVVQPTTLY
ncbi:MAG: transcription termination factor Rho [bacterium JZ-2024 1]